MDIFKDMGIGVPSGMKTSDKQALADVVNEAVTNSSTVKTNLTTALNSKLGTSLTGSNTWTEINSGIANATGVKKIKTGTVTSGSVIESVGSTYNEYTVYVTGLSFQPSYILVTLSTNPYYGTTYKQGANMLGYTGQDVVFVSRVSSAQTATKNGNGVVLINNTSFKLPVGYSSTVYEYIAIE